MKKPILPKQLSSEVVTILTKLLSKEFLAHYFYMNAANWCNNAGYFNAGKFFQSESDSELQHAKGIQDYLVQWNHVPEIPKVDTSQKNTDLVQIINDAYNLEYDLFQDYANNSKNLLIKDIVTFDFLEKYRQIQTDSVAEYSDLLNVLATLGTLDEYKVLYFEMNFFKPA